MDLDQECQGSGIGIRMSDYLTNPGLFVGITSKLMSTFQQESVLVNMQKETEGGRERRTWRMSGVRKGQWPWGGLLSSRKLPLTYFLFIASLYFSPSMHSAVTSPAQHAVALQNPSHLAWPHTHAHTRTHTHAHTPSHAHARTHMHMHT